MSGSSIPANTARAFTSQVSVTVPNVQPHGTQVTMPVPPNPDATLYDTLILNHGPFDVQVIGAQATDGTVTRLPNGPWIKASTSQVMPPGIIAYAATLTMMAATGVSAVEVHRGIVGQAALAPVFTIIG